LFRAPIAVLLDLCRPTAIFLGISFVIVDSVDRHPQRRFAHILKEICELSPSFADSDSTTAVVLPGWMFWIAAAVVHTFPATIIEGYPIGTGGSVFKTSRGGELAVQTATASRMSVSEAGAPNFGESATIAATEPFVWAALRAFDCNKPTETLTCDIDDLRHAGLLQRLSRLGTIGARRRRSFRLP
jgi:hypothetical protein